MTTPLRSVRLLAGAATLATLAWPAGLLGATRSVDERRPADPQGLVEIQSVAGRLDVEGWDKPEVAVTGTLGADVERVDIASAGARTTIRVVVRESHGPHLGGQTRGPGCS